jgi:alpha-D-xyloside xylohydrolase
MPGTPKGRMPDEITFQNDPVDPALEFPKQHNHFFVAERAERLEPDRAAGEVLWKRMSLVQRVSCHQVTQQLEDHAVWSDKPEREYEDEPTPPFRLDFISPRCVRVRLASRPAQLGDDDGSIMLERCEQGEPWEREEDGEGPGWHTLAIDEIPAVVLVRDGASLRLAEPAQHTGELDWDAAREWRS